MIKGSALRSKSGRYICECDLIIMLLRLFFQCYGNSGFRSQLNIKLTINDLIQHVTHTMATSPYKD